MAGIILTMEFNLPTTWGENYVNYIDDKAKALTNNVNLEETMIYEKIDQLNGETLATENQKRLIKEYYKISSEENFEKLNFNQANEIIRGTITSSFVDYISNDSKVKNYAISKTNNKEIIECSFDLDKTSLTKEDLSVKRKKFGISSKNSGLLYKGVFSFEDNYLIENKILKIEGGKKIIDDELLKYSAQNSIEKLMELEKFNDSSVVHAGIHYNTDNIHIHFAIAEENPTKKKGKVKEKNIKKTKSKFVSELEYNKDHYKEMQKYSDKIKEDILSINNNKKSLTLLKEIKLLLPKEGRATYDFQTEEVRLKVDYIIGKHIEKSKDYKSFVKIAMENESKYQRIYGKKNDYSTKKINNLNKELKNQLLKQIKVMDIPIQGSNRVFTRINKKNNNFYNGLNSIMKKEIHKLKQERRRFEKDLEEEINKHYSIDI